jgi:hypothetical protein
MNFSIVKRILAPYYNFEEDGREGCGSDIAGGDNTGTLTNMDLHTDWVTNPYRRGSSLHK